MLCFLTGFGIRGTEVTPKLEHHRLLWLETPSQWLGCEWENIYSAGDKSTILDPQWHRPPGVLRMASMTWRVYHNPGNYSDLGFVFVDRCIAARVPSDWDPHAGPPELAPVRLEDGWLGSHEHWAVPVGDIPETNNENARIAPYTEFEGDRTLADDIAGIELFANTAPLGTGADFTGGEAPFGSTRNATCTVEVTVSEPGVHALLARYTTRDEEVGWSNPAPIVIWPAED